MKRSNKSDISFKYPVKGIDPVTKGSFVIEWATMLWDWDKDDEELTSFRALGSFNIQERSPEENPLFKIAKETPLRLQGLLASVNFGTQKKFVKIIHISNYSLCSVINGSASIDLNVTFEILNNLDYLEKIQDYKDDNLL
jgi:hypothetical protein